MAWALERLYEKDYNYDAMLNLMMNQRVRDEVKKMPDPRGAEALWEDDAAAFRKVREKYLLY